MGYGSYLTVLTESKEIYILFVYLFHIQNRKHNLLDRGNKPSEEFRDEIISTGLILLHELRNTGSKCAAAAKYKLTLSRTLDLSTAENVLSRVHILDCSWKSWTLCCPGLRRKGPGPGQSLKTSICDGLGVY